MSTDMSGLIKAGEILENVGFNPYWSGGNSLVVEMPEIGTFEPLRKLLAAELPDHQFTVIDNQNGTGTVQAEK